MRILMLIPVWRRPEVLQVMIYHMKSIIPDYCEVMPLFILSEEDPDYQTNKWQVRGFRCLTTNNYPLGEKMNAGLAYAKQFRWNWLMGMGSDNVYTPRLWELYRNAWDCFNFFGINDYHVYNPIDEQAMFLRSYNTGMDDRPAPIGAGRCIKRELVQDIDELWRPEFNWGMDGSSAFTLYQHGHIPAVIETNGEPVMLDIKTLTNLTQWVELKGEPVEVAYVRRAFGLDDDQIIDSEVYSLLTFDGFRTEVCRKSVQLGTRRDAFNSVNEVYRQTFGEPRYKNYDSYKTQVTKQSKR